jgi:hypothetical protein
MTYVVTVVHSDDEELLSFRIRNAIATMRTQGMESGYIHVLSEQRLQEIAEAYPAE